MKKVTGLKSLALNLSWAPYALENDEEKELKIAGASLSIGVQSERSDESKLESFVDGLQGIFHEGLGATAWESDTEEERSGERRALGEVESFLSARRLSPSPPEVSPQSEVLREDLEGLPSNLHPQGRRLCFCTMLGSPLISFPDFDFLATSIRDQNQPQEEELTRTIAVVPPTCRHEPEEEPDDFYMEVDELADDESILAFTPSELHTPANTIPAGIPRMLSSPTIRGPSSVAETSERITNPVEGDSLKECPSSFLDTSGNLHSIRSVHPALNPLFENGRPPFFPDLAKDWVSGLAYEEKWQQKNVEMKELKELEALPGLFTPPCSGELNHSARPGPDLPGTHSTCPMVGHGQGPTSTIPPISIEQSKTLGSCRSPKETSPKHVDLNQSTDFMQIIRASADRPSSSSTPQDGVLSSTHSLSHFLANFLHLRGRKDLSQKVKNAIVSAPKDPPTKGSLQKSRDPPTSAPMSAPTYVPRLVFTAEQLENLEPIRLVGSLRLLQNIKTFQSLLSHRFTIIERIGQQANLSIPSEFQEVPLLNPDLVLDSDHCVVFYRLSRLPGNVVPNPISQQRKEVGDGGGNVPEALMTALSRLSSGYRWVFVIFEAFSTFHSSLSNSDLAPPDPFTPPVQKALAQFDQAVDDYLGPTSTEVPRARTIEKMFAFSSDEAAALTRQIVEELRIEAKGKAEETGTWNTWMDAREWLTQEETEVCLYPLFVATCIRPLTCACDGRCSVLARTKWT